MFHDERAVSVQVDSCDNTRKELVPQSYIKRLVTFINVYNQIYTNRKQLRLSIPDGLEPDQILDE